MLSEPNPTMQLPNKRNADQAEEEYLDNVIDEGHRIIASMNGNTDNAYVSVQVDSLLYLLTRYRLLLNHTDNSNSNN
jgi:exosome complex RNA-binding protein Csl4